jgi:nucleoside 2-deoxyribosyltransferase
VTKPLFYVAGPYTRPDPIVNVRRAVDVADQLVHAGAAVVVPHLTMLWHLVSPASVDEWYRRDLDVLEHCDALVRFSGESVGAHREVGRGIELGLPVWWLTESDVVSVNVNAWIKEWRSA